MTVTLFEGGNLKFPVADRIVNLKIRRKLSYYRIVIKIFFGNAVIFGGGTENGAV